VHGLLLTDHLSLCCLLFSLPLYWLHLLAGGRELNGIVLDHWMDNQQAAEVLWGGCFIYSNESTSWGFRRCRSRGRRHYLWFLQRTGSEKLRMAPGEGFEPSRPQRTTGFVSSIPGLGSSTWDLPRTRLGNPGVSQSRLSIVAQLLLNRHKDSREIRIHGSPSLVAPHSRVCPSSQENSHDLGGYPFLLLNHGFA
jgi:hypothetical protein